MSPQPIAVIGAGLAGAAAAWRLAQAGHDVTVLERSVPANPLGSSHGSARIFRYAYPDPFYTQLVEEARRGWNELEDLSGTELITSTGAVDFGSRRAPEQLGQVLADRGIPHELLDTSAATARWPGISFDGPVLWHEGAGVIDAESSVTAMIHQAEAAGARVLTDWTAQRVSRTADGYEIESNTGDTARASQIVIAAGGWIGDLLNELDIRATSSWGFPPIQVRQEQALHFPYRTDEEAWPTMIHKSDKIQTYALPGGRDAQFRGHKVAEYNSGRVLRSATENDGVIDPSGRARLIEYVQRTLPGLVAEPYAESTCLFTNLPHEDFLMDRVDGITFVSPCSGHGAKFAPLIGELVTRLVEGSDAVPTRFRQLQKAARS